MRMTSSGATSAGGFCGVCKATVVTIRMIAKNVANAFLMDRELLRIGRLRAAILSQLKSGGQRIISPGFGLNLILRIKKKVNRFEMALAMLMRGRSLTCVST